MRRAGGGVVDRYDLNDIIQSVGRAMFTLEGWERAIELGQTDAQRYQKAMIIRAHILATATFDQLKDLRDQAMICDNPEAIVTPAGRFRPLLASMKWDSA